MPDLKTNAKPETLQVEHGRGESRRGSTSVLLWIALGALAFHTAYAWSQTALLVGVYLFALVQLARTDTWRRAFYSGLALGMHIAVIRLQFFWTIFSAGAIALWLVYAFWLGLFAALSRLCLKRFGAFGWLAIPFLWGGLEYFRSELYFLRFSWLSPGFAFGLMPQQIPLHQVGVYGLSFLLVSLACLAGWEWSKAKLASALVLILGLCAIRLWGFATQVDAQPPPLSSLRIAGVQMEFPTEKEVLVRLKEAIRKYPESELLLLSEYTFTEPVPERIKNWCHENHRYLIVGGEEPVPGGNFHNTAFVISPAGETVFRQVKAVPIQFFKDGLPAPEQKLWQSPWGKIGICICYDLSYRRVTDQLIRLGAQALIVPTMDVVDWGFRQHELHARVAPVRVAEYGVPIFRVASSGISQFIDGTGHLLASAPFAADGAIIAGTLEMRGAGRIPLDQWLAPTASWVTALIMLLLCFGFFRNAGPPNPLAYADSGAERFEARGSMPKTATAPSAGTPQP